MTRYDKLAAIKREPTNHWAEPEERSEAFERIFAEIGVAEELSKLKDGKKADKLAEKAVDYLYAKFTAQSVITDADCLAAEKILLPLSEDAKKYTLYCVAHAHIDMDWLWGYHETVAITLGTFRTMLDLMNEYPGFMFSQSQAATYEIAEKYDPELFEGIKKRVAEGRWEFAGSSWVESDRNLPSAESISRHILYTKNYLQDKFNVPPDSINLDFHPDSFGHTPVLPEILCAGGVKYFYHCRGVDGRFIYRWRAPSGAELLAYNEPQWYNDAIRPDALALTVRFCEMHKGIDGMMKVYGVGDHGGGPTRRDLERIIAMNSWPVAPTVKFSTYAEFFSMLDKNRDSFPVYEEELGPTFTGCYTSESLLKTSNRVCEDRLTSAETLTALSVMLADGGKYPLYEEAWKKTLFNQFHDILPGSGVPETKNHALGNFEEVLAVAGSGATLAMRRFAEKIDTSAYETPDCPLTSRSEGGGVGCQISEGKFFKLPSVERGRGKTRIVTIFNTTQYDRREVAEVGLYDWLGIPSAMTVKDSDGADVAFSAGKAEGDNGHMRTPVFIDASVPAFGYATYIISEGEKTSYKFADFTPDLRRTYYKNPVLENELIRAEFDENDMTLVSLKDKKTDKEYIFRPSAYFALAYENDKYIGANAWVEGIHTSEINLNSSRRAVQTGLSQNGLRSKLTYFIKFNSSRLDVTVSLDKDADALKFEVSADWREIMDGEGCPKLLFKAPFGYSTNSYVYDVQLGTYTRPECSLHDSFGRDFIFAPNGGDKGIALFTDTKYGYRGSDDTLQVSILRATSSPDRYPEFGARRVRLALSLSDGTYDNLHKTALSLENDMPFISGTAHSGTLPITGGFVSCIGACVSSLKTAENGDGLVLRLYNPLKEASKATVSFGVSVKTASVSDTCENAVAPLAVSGGEVKLEIGAGAMTAVTVTF